MPKRQPQPDLNPIAHVQHRLDATYRDLVHAHSAWSDSPTPDALDAYRAVVATYEQAADDLGVALRATLALVTQDTPTPSGNRP